MENITYFATLFCVSSVASGILVFLIPEGRLKKTAEIVVVLFMMVSLISAVSENSDAKIDMSVNSFSEIKDYSVDFNEYLIEQSRHVTEKLLTDELSNICSRDFTVNTTWRIDDKNICMDSVCVKISQSDMSKISLIKNKVNAITGMIPEVVCE